MSIPYPKRLKKEEMNLIARMMTTADIFKVLTAVDRPYKQCKTLSKAIGIMTSIKEAQHIVPDLFLSSCARREYAQRCFRPESIDTEDVTDHKHAAARRAPCGRRAN